MNENEVLVGGFLQAEDIVYSGDGNPQLKFKLELEPSPSPDIPSYGIDCFYALDSTRNWEALTLGEVMETYLIVKGKLGKCIFPDESDYMKKGAIIIAKSIKIYGDCTDIEELLSEYPFRLQIPKVPELPKGLQIPENKDEG